MQHISRSMFDSYLFSYVYDKIWSELSVKDKKVIALISDGVTKAADIRGHFGMFSQLLNVYRKRLFEQGLINTSVHGVMTLSLPRFENYVKTFGAIYE